MSGPASRTWLSKLKAAAWLTPVAICFNDMVAGPVRVEGRSMQPTFNPPVSASKDIVLVQKWAVRFYRYGRGDVVILRSPTEPSNLIVKRLLALEGDWLAVPGRSEIVKVPKGHCWVEGDSPTQSDDSRNLFGPIPVAMVEGHVTHIMWPPSRLGPVTSAMPHGRLLARNDNAFSVDDSLL